MYQRHRNRLLRSILHNDPFIAHRRGKLEWECHETLLSARAAFRKLYSLTRFPLAQQKEERQGQRHQDKTVRMWIELGAPAHNAKMNDNKQNTHLTGREQTLSGDGLQVVEAHLQSLVERVVEN